MDDAELRKELEALYRLKHEAIFGSSRDSIPYFSRLTDGEVENYFQSKIDEVFPSLIQLRLELNSTGPLTEDEYYKASFRASHLRNRKLQVQFQKSVEQSSNPRKRELLALLSQNFEQDMKDMEVFGNPDLTEEEYQEVISKIIERMKGVSFDF